MPTDQPLSHSSAERSLSTGMLGLLARALLPATLVGLGVYGYQRVSVEPPQEKAPPPAEQLIRTKVATLHVADHQVVVKTNGIVQAHNQVTLSAEVSGSIVEINPALEAGSYFSKGDVLIRLDDRDYRTQVNVAKAQQKVATSARDLAQSHHDRIKELSEGNSASDTEVDQAIADLAQAQAQLDVAISGLEQAERDLERTEIVAPFNGRVRQKVVGLGQLLAPGTMVAEIFAVDYAEVRLPIANRQLRHLRLPEHSTDPAVEVSLRDAIDQQSPHRWTASIVRTEGTLDENSLELFAIARIIDPFGLNSGGPVLRIGQPVVATIQGETLADVISMPRKAVRQLNQVVLIDAESMTLRSTTIQPVWSDEETVYVRDTTIQDGTLLATTRLVYAPDGGKVEVIPETADASTSETAMVTE